MSIYWLAWGVSRGAAPLIGGLLNDHLAPKAIWLGGLTIGLLSTAGLLILTRLKRPTNASLEPAL